MMMFRKVLLWPVHNLMCNVIDPALSEFKKEYVIKIESLLPYFLICVWAW